MNKLFLCGFLSLAVFLGSGCGKKSGCPTLESQVDYNKALGQKPKKAKSGLLPSDGKKYYKKNLKRSKK